MIFSIPSSAFVDLDNLRTFQDYPSVFFCYVFNLLGLAWFEVNSLDLWKICRPVSFNGLHGRDIEHIWTWIVWYEENFYVVEKAIIMVRFHVQNRKSERCTISDAQGAGRHHFIITNMMRKKVTVLIVESFMMTNLGSGMTFPWLTKRCLLTYSVIASYSLYLHKVWGYLLWCCSLFSLFNWGRNLSQSDTCSAYWPGRWDEEGLYNVWKKVCDEKFRVY